MQMDQLPNEGRRVAFFGGSFDPPHLGHLAVARAARTALRLDTVLFAPVGYQPLKPQGSTASFEDRLAMTQVAIAAEPGFEVSLADAPKPSGTPNFTLQTLQNLRTELGPDGVLFCLMGADSFLGLRHWRWADEIPFAAPLIIASRPGQQLDDLAATLPPGLTLDSDAVSDRVESGVEVRSYFLRNLAGQRTPFYVLPGLHVEISASQIREQIHDTSARPEGRHALLSHAVFEFIRSRGLYR
jgi:nicotinate-nucleotide adenylyltransferase